MILCVNTLEGARGRARGYDLTLPFGLCCQVVHKAHCYLSSILLRDAWWLVGRVFSSLSFPSFLALDILVKRQRDGSLRLIPIDHGYCLPASLSIEWYDWVWYDWPQAKEPFDEDALVRARVL